MIKVVFNGATNKFEEIIPDTMTLQEIFDTYNGGYHGTSILINGSAILPEDLEKEIKDVIVPGAAKAFINETLKTNQN